ncbi:MAG: cytochrome b/b6 domain-containing protein [Syntrophaceae bacterium]|nr:cytochrome b/b6 domain-containing protein [Syntrophaceae bacterium]
MKQVIMYQGTERLWHWLQAALIIFLLLTGFELHGTYEIFGYEDAYELHAFAAWTMIITTLFAIVWHIYTHEWRQYIPTLKDLDKVIRCYLIGIFYDEPHPFKKKPEAKLNPLQRLSYLYILLIVFPVLIISGLVCFFYNELQAMGLPISFEAFAIIHTICAFLMLIFLVIHIYMTTTGKTPWAYTVSMITGRDEIEEEDTKLA